MTKIGKSSGEFVLFIRCGSYLPLCLKNYSDNDSIIVVLSLYQKPLFPIDENIWVVEGGVSKFDAAKKFFTDFPKFCNYSVLALFDPDVELEFSDVSILFHKGLADNKAIYQAALATSSHTHWRFLKTRDTRGWREVSFVEVMAPFFRRDALQLVIGRFSDSISSWGLEYYWYAKCGKMSTAVYDPIIMKHEAAVDLSGGPFYKYLETIGINPFDELSRLKVANVGRFFIECNVPKWTPLFFKKHYVSLLGFTVHCLDSLRRPQLLGRLLKKLHKKR